MTTPTPHFDLEPYLYDPARQAVAVLEWARRSKQPGYRLTTFGVAEMDDAVTLFPGSLTAVAGRPGHGKSQLLKHLAARAVDEIRAEGSDECVVFVTLEESVEMVAATINGLGISSRDIHRGRFDLAALEADVHALIPRNGLMVLAHPGIVGSGKNRRLADPLTSRRILDAISRIEVTTTPPRKPRLVLLDYLQLLQPDRDARHTEATKTAEVMAAVEGAKGIAASTKCAVVIAVQAGRESDNRRPPMPQLADMQWACVAGDGVMRVGDGSFSTVADLFAAVEAGRHPRVLSMGAERMTWAPIKAAKCNGETPAVRVRLTSGLSVDVTANHKFYAAPGVWLRADELDTDAHIALAGRHHTDPMDAYTEADKMMVLGMLLGDGCVTRMATLTNSEDAVLTEYTRCVESAWPEMTTSLRKQTAWETYDCTAVRSDGRAFPRGNAVINWLREIGVFGQKAETKSIPRLAINHDEARVLLAGLILTDGSIGADSQAITFATASRTLATQVAMLGMQFGADGGIGKVRGEAMYSVRWSGDGARAIANVICDCLVGRKRLAAERLIRGSRGNGRSRSNLLPPEFCMAAIHAVAGDRERFNMVKGRRITRDRMLEVAVHTGRADLRAAANSGLTWRKVASVTPIAPVVTYDFEIEGTHTFVVNGFVTHNSSIEQACDTVLGVLRPIRHPLYDEDGGGERPDFEHKGRNYPVTDDLAVFGIVKQRHGDGYGTFVASMDPKTSRMSEHPWSMPIRHNAPSAPQFIDRAVAS